MNESTTCPGCGAPMRTFIQPALVPGRAPLHMADCSRPTCIFYRVTLTLGTHAQLTDSERAAYGASDKILEAQ